mgnify:CR=1 FL=1
MQLQDRNQKHRKDWGRQSAYFGMFLALSLIFSYVETLIPISFGIPGIKLGLANIVTVTALYYAGTKEAFVLAILRNILTGFLFGNLFAIFYSIAGSCFSILIMHLLKKRGSFSVIGVSIAGGVFHNIGQLLVAMLVVESFEYFLLYAGAVDSRNTHRSSDRATRTEITAIFTERTDEMISYIKENWLRSVKNRS